MIRNYTPHDICIYSADDVVYVADKRKYFVKDDSTPLITIPSAGMLSVKTEFIPIESLEGIPQFKTVVTGIDEPPKDCICIVSVQYAITWLKMGRDISNLRVVSQVVYRNLEHPYPVGCLGLSLIK